MSRNNQKNQWNNQKNQKNQKRQDHELDCPSWLGTGLSHVFGFFGFFGYFRRFFGSLLGLSLISLVFLVSGSWCANIFLFFFVISNNFLVVCLDCLWFLWFFWFYGRFLQGFAWDPLFCLVLRRVLHILGYVFALPNRSEAFETLWLLCVFIGFATVFSGFYEVLAVWLRFAFASILNLLKTYY